MREKILELLRDQFLISFKMGDNEEKLYQAIADKIMKIAEFEALCNPDLYEAHMNEDIEERIEEESSLILGRLSTLKFTGDAIREMQSRGLMWQPEDNASRVWEYGFHAGYEYLRRKCMNEIIPAALEYGWLNSVPSGDEKERLFGEFIGRLS